MLFLIKDNAMIYLPGFYQAKPDNFCVMNIDFIKNNS